MPPRSVTPTDLARSIALECERIGLGVPETSVPLLAAYATALWSWNERLNLTRHTDVERFVARDVADAAAITPHLTAQERILDVGTGGGVPGVLLAILRPDVVVELSDSVAKRAKAVEGILSEIGLRLPVHARAAQEVVRGTRFDTLVVRAVAPLVKLLGWFEPLSDRFGRMLVIKGPRWEAEKGEARHHGFVKRVRIRRIAGWPIPGSDGESVLLEIHPRALPSAEAERSA